jgi:hypothetical protein
MLTGHRKFTLGAMYLIMSWAAFVWSPGMDTVIRTSILQSQVIVFGLVIGGNVVENLKKPSS